MAGVVWNRFGLFCAGYGNEYAQDCQDDASEDQVFFVQFHAVVSDKCQSDLIIEKYMITPPMMTPKKTNGTIELSELSVLAAGIA